MFNDTISQSVAKLQSGNRNNRGFKSIQNVGVQEFDESNF